MLPKVRFSISGWILQKIVKIRRCFPSLLQSRNFRNSTSNTSIYIQLEMLRSLSILNSCCSFCFVLLYIFLLLFFVGLLKNEELHQSMKAIYYAKLKIVSDRMPMIEAKCWKEKSAQPLINHAVVLLHNFFTCSRGNWWVEWILGVFIRVFVRLWWEQKK